MYDLIVIGAGAAGLICACVAASNGRKVLLLEKNEKPGRKLYITGKGRCNLTNNCPVPDVISNIPTGGKFLYSAISRFSPTDVMEYFEHLGVPLKTERAARVFPVSDRAADIVDALYNNVRDKGVHFRTDTVVALIKQEDKIVAVKTKNRQIPCQAVVLATGGMSYSATGSTGDGYEMAKNLGHTIMKPRGSLVPLVAQPELCSKMQGLALKNVQISIYDGGKKPIYTDFGEMLFTHFGLSGPLILSASAHMRHFDKKSYYITIDLKPALDEKKLDLRILRDFEKFKDRDFANSLGELVNKSMIPIIIEMSEIPPETKVHSITRAQRLNLIRVLKSFEINITGPRPVDEAIITSGGVSLKEINPKTMESKLISGLYFAGEIIDADGYTGGFNLQIAWSTGYAAALGAAEQLDLALSIPVER